MPRKKPAKKDGRKRHAEIPDQEITQDDFLSALKKASRKLPPAKPA